MDVIPVMKKIGNRSEVWNNIARQTPGGLTKKDLFISKIGKITSKKASLSSKKRIAEGKGFCKMCFEKFGKKPEIVEAKQNVEVKEQIPYTKEYSEILRKELDNISNKINAIVERTGKDTSKEIKELKKIRDKTRNIYYAVLRKLRENKQKQKNKNKSKNKKKSK